jgi:hypothetical protein
VTIRNKLDYIDTLLRKECLFCGPVLIDMVDNDVATVDSKMYEFGGLADPNAPEINQYGAGSAFDTDMEWEID